MTTFQKVIKYLAIAFAVFLTVSIFSGILGVVGVIGGFLTGEPATGEMLTYSVTGEVRDLYIEIPAADLSVKEGDAFWVESNLKNLKVEEDGGRLSVMDVSKTKISGFSAKSGETPVLTLYVPAGFVFENVNVSTGAGRLTIDTLSAETVDFELGAGEVSIGSLSAKKSADIEGGAGRITVSGGAMNDLDLDMGVGELNLTSALSGDCRLDMGVGESNVTLIGSRDDYRLDIEKGIGSICVDGKNVSDFGTGGAGANEVEITGGVGAINITFDEGRE